MSPGSQRSKPRSASGIFGSFAKSTMSSQSTADRRHLQTHWKTNVKQDTWKESQVAWKIIGAPFGIENVGQREGGLGLCYQFLHSSCVRSLHPCTRALGHFGYEFFCVFHVIHVCVTASHHDSPSHLEIRRFVGGSGYLFWASVFNAMSTHRHSGWSDDLTWQGGW